jgi:hypothetical protein
MPEASLCDRTFGKGREIKYKMKKPKKKKKKKNHTTRPPGQLVTKGSRQTHTLHALHACMYVNRYGDLDLEPRACRHGPKTLAARDYIRKRKRDKIQNEEAKKKEEEEESYY